MSIPNYKKGGLIKDKYLIFKSTSNGIIPVDLDSKYFVLRVDKDPHALIALYAYAISVKRDNKELSDDLLEWIGELIK